ncbi:MAG: hypothetical protein CMK92_04695, partial [Pseudomonas sp.]|nr:hypothetical protein [Pseudomonas sp.]
EIEARITTNNESSSGKQITKLILENSTFAADLAGRLHNGVGMIVNRLNTSHFTKGLHAKTAGFIRNFALLFLRGVRIERLTANMTKFGCDHSHK